MARKEVTKVTAKKTVKQSKFFEESLWETATTYKLSKLNLAVRGLSANLSEVPADTFFKDQHPGMKADSERSYRNREGETLLLKFISGELRTKEIGSIKKEVLA